MRRRKAEKRETVPDLQYNSKLISTLINMVMIQGKKSKAERIVYDALETLKKRTNTQDALAILTKSVDNARPLLELKSRRVGGATYQVPVEVKSDRGATLALRWMRDFARNKKGKPMQEKLAQEILDSYNNTGNAIKKKEDTHKMAEANKAFAHYRW
ncbi:MAG: 30S ribosomal protein S7 [Candidatus Omnitrophota bacterium]